MNELYDVCPICRSNKFDLKFMVKEFEIDQCCECKVVFVRNIMPISTLTDLYETDEFVFSKEYIVYLNYHYCKLRDEIYAITKKSSGSILDVGCSGGYFLDLMKGWNCYGIEISEKEASVAKAKFGENIFTGVIENYQIKQSFFDVITLQDVLDHCTNPVEVITICHRMLKQNGLIVIKVHDISCFYAKISGKNFYAIIPPVHLFYFNKNTLRFILKNNFNIVKFRYFGQVLQLRTVFYRLSKGNRDSLYYKVYLLMNNSFIGKFSIYKNLHDIITVFAKKDS